MRANVFILILVLAGGGYWAYQTLRPNPYGERLTFEGGEEIYYRGGATESDARGLGQCLQAAGYFDGENEKSVFVAADPPGYRLQFVVIDTALANPEVHDYFRQLGALCAARAFGGARTAVELCDAEMSDCGAVAAIDSEGTGQGR